MLLIGDRRAAEPDRDPRAALVERDLAVGEVEGLAAHLAGGRAFVLGRGPGGHNDENRNDQKAKP